MPALSKIPVESTNLLTIGDCLVFRHPDGKYIGLLLKKIVRTVDYVTYGFFIAGKAFDTIPTFEDFSAGGLFGRRVPSHCSSEEIESGAYIELGKYTTSFDQVDLFATTLESIKNKFHIVGNIDFRREKIHSGSYSVANDLKALAEEYDRLASKLGQVDFYGKIEQESFPLKDILGKEEDKAAKAVTEQWILSKNNAHPRALDLLKEDFFWAQMDDFAPFGSDAGSDALHFFREYRQKYPEEDPAFFLFILGGRWTLFPDLDPNGCLRHLMETDVRNYPSYEDGTHYYIGIDRSVLGACFGQLLLEGEISQALRDFGILALKRQLSRPVRKLFDQSREMSEKLGRQLEVLENL